MKIYKVGGAVRDELLGLKPTDNDWVVVGSTPKQMLSMGYKQVGKDFPVFLHPDTKEEYALARTEKTIGLGHRDFKFNFDSTVTLEEDLSRRDITINAIAKDENDKLIDPFGGLDDIKKKKIRHVSDAFKDDPLRIFRAARFVHKLKSFRFEIQDETMNIMQDMTGDITHLSPERIWNETEKALNYHNTAAEYFYTLYEIFYDTPFYRNVIMPNSKLLISSGALYQKDELFHYWEVPSNFDSQLILNDGLRSPESWWSLVSLLAINPYWLNEKLRVPKSFSKMSEHVLFFRSYFENYHNFDFHQKIDNLFTCMEKIQSCKDAEYATDIVFLASHNILSKYQLSEWPNFILEYSNITPSNEEKKLESDKIVKILKKRKIELIEKYLLRNHQEIK